MTYEQAQAKRDALIRAPGQGEGMTYDHVRVVGTEQTGFSVEVRDHLHHTEWRPVAE